MPKAYRLTSLADPEVEVPGDRLGYVFAGSELNISSWVYYGRASAGALSALDWQSQDENPAAFRKEFRILHNTGTVPRMLVLGRPGLDPELSRAALAPYLIDAFHPIEDPDAFVAGLEEALKHGGTGASP